MKVRMTSKDADADEGGGSEADKRDERRRDSEQK